MAHSFVPQALFIWACTGLPQTAWINQQVSGRNTMKQRNCCDADGEGESSSCFIDVPAGVLSCITSDT